MRKITRKTLWLAMLPLALLLIILQVQWGLIPSTNTRAFRRAFANVTEVRCSRVAERPLFVLRGHEARSLVKALRVRNSTSGFNAGYHFDLEFYEGPRKIESVEVLLGDWGEQTIRLMLTKGPWQGYALLYPDAAGYLGRLLDAGLQAQPQQLRWPLFLRPSP